MPSVTLTLEDFIPVGAAPLMVIAARAAERGDTDKLRAIRAILKDMGFELEMTPREIAGQRMQELAEGETLPRRVWEIRAAQEGSDEAADAYMRESGQPLGAADALRRPEFREAVREYIRITRVGPIAAEA
jgi:hypothetical protein